MSGAELLVILTVAVIVFGPQKLPELATRLGRMMQYIVRIKQKTLHHWQLLENQLKAQKAEELYRQDKDSL